jgi:hypothetical protein
MNASARTGAVVSFLRGTKCAYLEKRSTTVRILQYPSVVRGRSMIKSIVMCYQGQSGIGNGAS